MQVAGWVTRSITEKHSARTSAYLRQPMHQPVITERQMNTSRTGRTEGTHQSYCTRVDQPTSVPCWVTNLQNCGQPTYRIVLLGKVRCEEEGYFGEFAAERVWWGKRGKERELQSTKPFQAETEALRAVSIVPPITTSFWRE